MSRRAGLSVANLEALASDADDSHAVGWLRQAQDGRRRLLLGALLQRADQAVSGAMAETRTEPAFAILAEAERISPSIVRELLLLPSTGAWLATALRLTFQTSVAADGFVIALRHLNALAATAALRTRLDFEAVVPVYEGRVLLPGLGSALVRNDDENGRALVLVRDGDATVECGSTSVQVGERERWRGVPVVTSRVDGLELEVAIDDVDRNRDCYGLTPAPILSYDELRDWTTRLREAWVILGRHHEPWARGIVAGFTSIVPLEEGVRAGVSCTSADAFGAAAISLPENGIDLAVALVHEFQHSKLWALAQALPLHFDDGKAYYAPWRDDPRPLGGLLHGCYAYFGVAGFWRRQRLVDDDAASHFEFARWCEQAWRTTNVLLGSKALTGVGTRFVSSLRENLRRWRSEPVPSPIARLARLAALDHWYSWRLRNLSPIEPWAKEAAQAWFIREPGALPPAPLSLTAGAFTPAERTRRDRLVHQRLRGPSAGGGPTGRDADEALVDGAFKVAARSYEAAIAADPTALDPWAGLAVALTLARAGDTPSGALTARPEVVAAVYRSVAANEDRPPAPGALARWLDDHVSGGSMSNSALTS